MNKLHIAVKLIHLLNERKQINSKVVAEELNVSIRTAQRYLNDLSALPCVLSTEQNRNNHFYLSPEYKLNEAFTNNSRTEQDYSEHPRVQTAAAVTEGAVCLSCGIKRGHLSEMVLRQGRTARQQINLIVSIVRKQLNLKKCPFP